MSPSMGTKVAAPTSVVCSGELVGGVPGCNPISLFLLPHPCPLPCWGIWGDLGPLLPYPAELAVLKALDEEVGGTPPDLQALCDGYSSLWLPRFPDAPMGGEGIGGGKYAPKTPLLIPAS